MAIIEIEVHVYVVRISTWNKCIDPSNTLYSNNVPSDADVTICRMLGDNDDDVTRPWANSSTRQPILARLDLPASWADFAVWLIDNAFLRGMLPNREKTIPVEFSYGRRMLGVADAGDYAGWRDGLRWMTWWIRHWLLTPRTTLDDAMYDAMYDAESTLPALNCHGKIPISSSPYFPKLPRRPISMWKAWCVCENLEIGQSKCRF